MGSDFTTLRAELDKWQRSHHVLKDKETCRDWCEFEYSEQIFISHRSVDSDWCANHILRPIESRFGRHSYFFLSGASAEQQRKLHNALVEHAFKFCKTIVIVMSRDYLPSEWTRCEAAWAIEQRHPIIICLKDATRPETVRSEFAAAQRTAHSYLPIELIDFTRDLALAESRLLELIESPAYKPGIAPLYAKQPGVGWGLEALDAWRKCNKKW